MSHNSGSNRAPNFKLASRFALVPFWNYSRDYFLNFTPLGSITITYHYDYDYDYYYYYQEKTKGRKVNPPNELFPKLILFKLFLITPALQVDISTLVTRNWNCSRRQRNEFTPIFILPESINAKCLVTLSAEELGFMSIVSLHYPGNKVYYLALTLHSPLQQTPAESSDTKLYLAWQYVPVWAISGISGCSTFSTHKYSQKTVCRFSH